jgi:hypothetical protein
MINLNKIGQIFDKLRLDFTTKGLLSAKDAFYGFVWFSIRIFLGTSLAIISYSASACAEVL